VKVPVGYRLRPDLRCRRCGREAIEAIVSRLDGSERTFRFSCVGYWGNGPKCWTCASPEGAFEKVGEQLPLF